MNAILDHKKGDTWDGIEMFFEDSEIIDNEEVFTPTDLTGCTFLARFKTQPAGSTIFEFKSADNTITFKDNDPSTGRIVFMPRKMDVPAQRYIFDIQMTSASGRVDTIYETDKEFAWNILQDVS